MKMQELQLIQEWWIASFSPPALWVFGSMLACTEVCESIWTIITPTERRIKEIHFSLVSCLLSNAMEKIAVLIILSWFVICNNNKKTPHLSVDSNFALQCTYSVHCVQVGKWGEQNSVQTYRWGKYNKWSPKINCYQFMPKHFLTTS